MGVISFRFRYSDCLRRKMFQPHDYIMLLHFYDVSTDVPLPDFLSLPSASYTRQSPWRQKGLCRLPLLGHSAKGLPRASANLPRGGGGWRRVCQVPNGRHSTKTKTLPECQDLALGKVWNFAECRPAGTRQSFKLCRVLNSWHSAKLLFLVYPLWPLLPSVFPYALGKVTKFFLFHFSLFFDTNTTKIYLNTGTLQAVIITNI